MWLLPALAVVCVSFGTDNWAAATTHELPSDLDATGPASRPISQAMIKFSSISVGVEHSCGLFLDNTLACWGNDEDGRATPPPGTFKSVSAGRFHTCAIRLDGAVDCWGRDTDDTPKDATFQSVSAGDGTCGIRSDGSVACWGVDRSWGPDPGGVFRQVSVGHGHVCGVRTDGTVGCWGKNDHGQAIPPAGSFRLVSAGTIQTCGVRTDGTIACWGSDWHGRSTPPSGTFTSVTTVWDHSCALRADGEVICWGDNTDGQGTPGEGAFQYVGVGLRYTCGLKIEGSAVCWGKGDHGRTSPARNNRVQSGIPIPSEPLVRGQSGDYWADIIIGKPDFAETGPGEVVPFKVFNPGGLFVDRSVDPGLAYIWDSGNNRILGVDLAKCYTDEGPCQADFVLGQPSLWDSGACNGDSAVQKYPYRAEASARTLCGVPDLALSPGEWPSFVNMDVDAMRNLYTPDSFNNRVLLYERPFEADGIADSVWGQEGFAETTCNRGDYSNPTAQSLCFHSVENWDRTPAYGGWPAAGVALDQHGNLWVADSGNNRVLRFPFDRTVGQPSDKADLVLGQPDFSHRDQGQGLHNLFSPGAVRFGPQGKLYVADTYNNRILVFDPPFRSGMAAATTFGHSFRSPNGLAIDPELQGIWVSDIASHLVSLWNWNGDRVLKVVGKADYQPDGRGLHFDEVPGGVVVHDVGGGFGFDRQSNLLVTETVNTVQDVLRFPHPIHELESGLVSRPDKRLFYPPGDTNFIGTKGIRDGDGIAVFQNQLVISGAYRLMFWNGLASLTNGKQADGVIGDERFHRYYDSCCENIKADGAGRLWVNSSEGVAGFIDVYQLPLTHQSAPLETFWAKGWRFPVLGEDEMLSVLDGRIWGIAPAEGGRFLWISDTDNHRVVRVRDPLTAPVVDVVLGQKAPDEEACNHGDLAGSHDSPIKVGPDMLCFPGNVAVDREGNVWVSDHALEVSGNFRLLMFSKDLFPTDMTKAVFAPPATKVLAEHGHGLTLAVDYDQRASSTFIESHNRGPYRSATFEPAFDSHNRMVVGYNSYIGGRFVGIYEDPTGVSTEPSGYLNDLASMPVAAAFDDQDNLYIGDHNLGRVLVYWDPFNNQRPVATTPRQLEPAAPLPDYPYSIKAVSPEPPSCVLRHDGQWDRTTLILTVPGLTNHPGIEIQVRKIASKDHYTWSVDGLNVRSDGENMAVSLSWDRLWSDYEYTWATARLLSNHKPITAWSKSFIIADDTSACAQVWKPGAKTTPVTPGEGTANPTSASGQSAPFSTAGSEPGPTLEPRASASPPVTPTPASMPLLQDQTSSSTPSSPAKTPVPVSMPDNEPVLVTQPIALPSTVFDESAGFPLPGPPLLWVTALMFMILMLGIAFGYYIRGVLAS